MRNFLAIARESKDGYVCDLVSQLDVVSVRINASLFLIRDAIKTVDSVVSEESPDEGYPTAMTAIAARVDADFALYRGIVLKIVAAIEARRPSPGGHGDQS